MSELRINLDDPFQQMLESLKPVVESVVEDELDFDSYVNLVLWRGMRGMIADIVPGDPEILMNSMLLMFEQNPEFIASFIGRRCGLVDGGLIGWSACFPDAIGFPNGVFTSRYGTRQLSVV